ncbi:MAG TPA: hypothetical protein VF350_02435 [Candidatus Bathyarchaeia archaeon]
MVDIEVQAVTQNWFFFFRVEERLTGVNWFSAEFNPLKAFVFLRRGGVLE